MNQADKQIIRTQIQLLPETLSINIEAQSVVIIQIKCGNHVERTQKAISIKNKKAQFQEVLTFNTKFKLNKGIFKEKKVTIQIILIYNNVPKKGGKIRLNISNYLNQQLQSVNDKQKLENCPDDKAYLQYQLKFKQAVEKYKIESIVQQLPQISNLITIQERPEFRQINNNQDQLQIKLRALESKYNLLEHDYHQLIQKELKYKEQINKLEIDKKEIELALCRQKQNVGLIMQVFLDQGNCEIVEDIEKIIKSN